MNIRLIKYKRRRRILELAIPLLALSGALMIIALMIVVSGNNPLKVYGFMIKSGFGSLYGFMSVLRWMTPLLFLSVAASFALRSGIWNIGLEGQMYMGALFGTWVGFSMIGVHGIVVQILSILLAACAGAFWAVIPALLRAYYNTNEFIVSLLLNFVAMYLTDFLTLEVWRAPGAGGQTMSTPEVIQAARFAKIIPGYAWHMGFFLGLAFVLFYWGFMKWTTLGFEFRVMGYNPYFLKYGGISVKRTIILSMCFSGAIAGIAGDIEILGIYKSFTTRMYAGGVAWDGLVVALLGAFRPIGLIIASFLFGFLKTGLLTIERMINISRSIITILQAMVIFFVAIQGVRISRRVEEIKERE